MYYIQRFILKLSENHFVKKVGFEPKIVYLIKTAFFLKDNFKVKHYNYTTGFEPVLYKLKIYCNNPYTK